MSNDKDHPIIIDEDIEATNGGISPINDNLMQFQGSTSSTKKKAPNFSHLIAAGCRLCSEYRTKANVFTEAIKANEMEIEQMYDKGRITNATMNAAF